MTILDRVPYEKITERAAEQDWGRLIAKTVVGLFYLIGWLIGRITARALLGGLVVREAVLLGYTSAGGPKPRPKRPADG